jgi:hypothetical protein
MRGDKSNISNYRGKSILSAIPKLFEKLVCDVITPTIRPSISELSCLVVFYNFVLEDRLQVDAVYTRLRRLSIE